MAGHKKNRERCGAITRKGKPCPGLAGVCPYHKQTKPKPPVVSARHRHTIAPWVLNPKPRRNDPEAVSRESAERIRAVNEKRAAEAAAERQREAAENAAAEARVKAARAPKVIRGGWSGW